MEGKISSVNNYCISIKEQGDSIIFLRKIIQGGADRSYGIQVAKLAGLPQSVLTRADELVAELVYKETAKKPSKIFAEENKESEISGMANQISIFDIINKTEGFDDIILEIHDMDLSRLTPIDALNLLYKYQTEMKEKF